MKYIKIITLLALLGCKSGSNISSSNRISDFIGPVKFVYEKTIPVIIDTNWSTTIDSLRIKELSYINYNIDTNGTINNWESFNWDSISLTKQDYIYSPSNKLMMINIYKNNNLVEIVKVVKDNKSLLKTKTYDSATGGLTTIYKMSYDSILFKRIILNKTDNKKITDNYFYNTRGNVSKIIRRSDYSDDDNGWTIKYLKYDQKDNWTECIYYDPNDYYTGSLKIRKFVYY